MEDRHEYEADVMYEVWRRGGNPDAVDYDDLYEPFHSHVEPSDMAEQIVREQRPARPARETEA